jgi:hypothetical protein
MKQNHGAMPEAAAGGLCADAVCAGFAGPALYAAAIGAALLEQTLRWIDQWCALSARYCGAGQAAPAEAAACEELDDLPRISRQDMLAHPRSMEFNLALHEMQERLFAGLGMGEHPHEPAPGPRGGALARPQASAPSAL